MLLKMIPAGLGMTSRTEFGDQAGTVHTLIFTLHLAGQGSLTLDTGEVFQNPAYAAVRGNKPNVLAQLNVRPASDEHDFAHNEMRYIGAQKGDVFEGDWPPMIYFRACMPASDYSLLLNNLRDGITPSYVTVGCCTTLSTKGRL
jgi:hypothetical protein